MLPASMFTDQVRSLLRFLLWLGVFLLSYRFLFRPLLPLIIAFLLSSLIATPVERLKKRSNLPVGLCAFLMTVLLLAMLSVGGYCLCRFALRQLKTLLLQLPAIWGRLQQSFDALQGKLVRWFPRQHFLPDFLSPSEWLEGIHAPEIDLDTLTSSLGRAATSLPNLLLTVVFILAATAMLTSR